MVLSIMGEQHAKGAGKSGRQYKIYTHNYMIIYKRGKHIE
jgi:hypothetical protein